MTSLSGNEPGFFQQLPHQFQGCTLVPFGLEQNVQDLTLRIYRTPKIDQTAADPEIDFIEMPDGVRLGPAFTQVRRNGGPEMVHPAAHRLMGHHDPALRQQVLDIPEAQREPDIQPDRVLDDPGRKAKPR